MRFESSHVARSRTVLPPTLDTFPLGSVTIEPAPVGRRTRLSPDNARTHFPSGDNAPPVPSPIATAGEPSTGRRKIVGLPEGAAPNSSSKTTVSPSGDMELANADQNQVRSRSPVSAARLQTRLIRMLFRDS